MYCWVWVGFVLSALRAKNIFMSIFITNCDLYDCLIFYVCLHVMVDNCTG